MGKPKKKLSAYNLYMQKALKGKMKGKTKAQRKAIFKAAARGWNKGKPRSTSRSSKPKSRVSPSRANPTGGIRNMTKNSFNMNKIYGLARKVALFAPAIGRAMGPGTAESKIDGIVADYTGYAMGQGDWNWERLKRGWMPFIATSVITKAIPALNKLIRSIF